MEVPCYRDALLGVRTPHKQTALLQMQSTEVQLGAACRAGRVHWLTLGFSTTRDWQSWGLCTPELQDQSSILGASLMGGQTAEMTVFMRMEVILAKGGIERYQTWASALRRAQLPAELGQC